LNTMANFGLSAANTAVGDDERKYEENQRYPSDSLFHISLLVLNSYEYQNHLPHLTDAPEWPISLDIG